MQRREIQGHTTGPGPRSPASVHHTWLPALKTGHPETPPTGARREPGDPQGSRVGPARGHRPGGLGRQAAGSGGSVLENISPPHSLHLTSPSPPTMVQRQDHQDRSRCLSHRGSVRGGNLELSRARRGRVGGCLHLVRALAWGQPFSALCVPQGLWLKLAPPLLPESLILGSGEARAALGSSPSSLHFRLHVPAGTTLC